MSRDRRIAELQKELGLIPPDPRDAALKLALGALEKIANDGVERSRDPRTLIAKDAIAAIREVLGDTSQPGTPAALGEERK